MEMQPLQAELHSVGTSTGSAPSHDPHQLLLHEQCVKDVSSLILTRKWRPPYYPTREETFISLRKSIPHTWRYSELRKSEKKYQKEARSHMKLMRRHSKDLCTVVNIYAFLQGSLFAAVAVSGIFTCKDRWGPAAIVVTVTMATVLSACDKLQHMASESQAARMSQRRQCAVYDKIARLQILGSLWEFDSLEPACVADDNTKERRKGLLLCTWSTCAGLPYKLLCFDDGLLPAHAQILFPLPLP